MKNWIKKFPYAIIAITAVILLTVMVKILSAPPTATPAGPTWVENNAQALEATLAVSTNPTEEAFIQSKLDQLRRIQATSGGSLQNVPINQRMPVRYARPRCPPQNARLESSNFRQKPMKI